MVSSDQTFHALADPRQLAFKSFLTTPRRFGRARCIKAPIEFGPDKRGVLDQADDLLPDNLVEQILADRTAVACGTAKGGARHPRRDSDNMDFARRAEG
ncbi:hypothetical protein ACWGS9_34545 [Bradyrhizobium sp. Arg314]